ncbi:MAG: B12-binding domain-containing radical SAM protein [Promethearchaeota archaeon]
MKILLVNPPSSFRLKSFNAVTLPDIPLNLAYIASALEEDGHFVRILDLNVIRTKSELLEELSDIQFNMLGFTATTSIILTCYRTIRIFKMKYPKAHVVLGGWHASGIPRLTMEDCKEIDFIVKGEGERTIVDLVHALEGGSDLSNVDGIVYRDESGKIIENRERALINKLDSIPFPARHLLPQEKYKKMGFITAGGYFKTDLGISSIATTRGCTGKCIFCADRVVNKGTCRFRSPENVVAEIKHAIKHYNIRIFFFTDPNFTLSPNHVKRICQLIIEGGIKILWSCTARVDTVSKEMLELMKKAGCTRVGYGIETGSPRVLKLVKKEATIEQARRAIKMTKKAGLFTVVYFLFGVPGEQVDDIIMSQRLLMETKPSLLSTSIAVPLPGSELYDRALEARLFEEGRWEFFNYPYNNVINLPEFKETFKRQAILLRRYYTSPFFIFHQLKSIRSIYHIKFYFKAIRLFVIGWFLVSFSPNKDSRFSSRNLE